MTISFDAWAVSVDGQYIDKDGYGDPVTQCHDVWLDYLVRVVGGSQTMGYAPTGFADSVWINFPVNGVDAVVTRYSGTEGLRKGDVVFWAYGSASYPFSHVAVALDSPSGGSVYCMTQNPGPTHREYLTLAGALGYLRPKNVTIGDDEMTPAQEAKLDSAIADIAWLKTRVGGTTSATSLTDGARNTDWLRERIGGTTNYASVADEFLWIKGRIGGAKGSKTIHEYLQGIDQKL